MIFKKIFSLYLIAIIVINFSIVLKAQNSTYWIDPSRGTQNDRRISVMQANQVQSDFTNYEVFGHSGDPYSGVWPKGTGHVHLIEMTMIAGAEVIGSDGQKYHVISQSYDGSPNISPSGKLYEWEPLPGYYNDHRHYVSPDGIVDDSSQIAHSADPTTWPTTWPGKDGSWDGHWNGYFGKDQFNADDEAYYVTDDFDNSKFPYYPFPDDSTKRGLGLQCETRLFEWAHPLAQNQVFIHFRITNASTSTKYDRTTSPIYFGAYSDINPGGVGAVSDMDSYDKGQNMVISYSYLNSYVWATYTSILPGFMGWKFLESPGISDDGIDNDNDGMIDERRDNSWQQSWAGLPPEIVGHDNVVKAFEATHDMNKFLKFYNLKSIEDVQAVRQGDWFPADENGNWNKETDDVGSDGIGPGDPNYIGPDPDGTEGNGKPDQGEPNFGFLDKDESDQIGLTSFTAPTYGAVSPNSEKQLWAQIAPSSLNPPQPAFPPVINGPANLLWIFSSGPFDLAPQQTERFSTVWLFGEDQNSLYNSAAISQIIYNNNYRFTKPPLQPILKAVAGDHKVTLYWDNRAEKSYNPIYGQNFEGYKIYRGTDPQLSEARVITDAYGNFAYYKPIAQFDLIDGIKGLSPVALGQELGNQYPIGTGIHYDMGNDSGLKYSFVDNDLINGVTYYYAIVAYDQGYYPGIDSLLHTSDRNLPTMSPSESPWSFTFNNNLLTSETPNTVIVTPNAPATNYNPGHTDADQNGFISYSSGPNSNSTGKVQVVVVAPDSIKNYKYEVSFPHTIQDSLGQRLTVAYNVNNLTTGNMIYDSASVPIDTSGRPVLNWPSMVFNGMYLNFLNVQPQQPYVMSQWDASRPENLQVSILKGGAGWIPENLTVEITAQPSYYPYKSKTPVYFKIYNNITGDTVLFQFPNSPSGDVNGNGKIDVGDKLTILGPQTGINRLGIPVHPSAYYMQFTAPSDTSVTPRTPQPGDKFIFVTNTPFGADDKFQFNSYSSSTKSVSKNVLNDIAVVPNPYIVGAIWEKANNGISGRGERKIEFMHLPAQCTIRIFTQNGYLLRTIHHTGSGADGSESWDLTTSEGLEVAFGIYVYQVEAPGIGPKIGTFAIIN